MASNVFGTPITDETLKGMPEYHDKKLTRLDRAYVALDMKNAEGKDFNARKFVENLRDAFSERVKTMCLIYNATGGPLTFVNAYDWVGRVCESPYPVIIANGQWGAFLHGQYSSGTETSRAGVVYAAKNSAGESKHWLISWHNSVNGTTNRVYTEIRETGHYQTGNTGTWAALDSLLSNQGLVYQANEYGGLLFASIGNTAVPIFEAILTLPEALNDN